MPIHEIGTTERALHHLNRRMARASRCTDDANTIERMAGRGRVESYDRVVRELIVCNQAMHSSGLVYSREGIVRA